MLSPYIVVIALLFSISTSAVVPVDNWKGRSIYFVVTDRFAGTGDDLPTCTDSKEWCGGSFDGLVAKLPYIKDMGFDAVWITPPVKQATWRDSYNGTGYHGYWAEDFMSIDEHLGGEKGLKALSEGLHKLDMLLMVDIVANHVGPVHSIEDVGKFPDVLGSSDGRQYNKLNMTGEDLDDYIKSGPPNAMRDAGDCWPWYNFDNCDRRVVESGWFGDLGDLNQGDEGVREYLLNWVVWMRDEFDIDGFRLDTALYIPHDFLSSFQSSAGVYIVGEVVMYNFTLHAEYQEYLRGLLNFPVTEHLGEAFTEGLDILGGLVSSSVDAGYKDRGLLGNFVDNHDGERFLHKVRGDVALLKNALAYTMLSEGIPIVYYGTEVLEVAGNDDNRVGMWEFGYDSSGEVGELIKAMNGIRKEGGLGWGGKDVDEKMVIKAADANWFVFQRGSVVAFVNNFGKGNGGGKSKCFEGLEWGNGTTVLYGDGRTYVGEEGQACVELGEGADPVVTGRM